MPSPGNSPLSPPPSHGWLWASLGAVILIVATYAAMYQPDKTSLSAGELEESVPIAAGNSAAQPVSTSILATASAPLSPAKAPPADTRSTPGTSTNQVGFDQLIPTMDLTAEALTRHLQDLSSVEMHQKYTLASMPSGKPAPTPSAPAKASPTQ